MDEKNDSTGAAYPSKKAITLFFKPLSRFVNPKASSNGDGKNSDDRRLKIKASATPGRSIAEPAPPGQERGGSAAPAREGKPPCLGSLVFPDDQPIKQAPQIAAAPGTRRSLVDRTMPANKWRFHSIKQEIRSCVRSSQLAKGANQTTKRNFHLIECCLCSIK